MKDGNVETGAQTLFDFETFWSLNVFEVDATKCWGDALNEINNLIGCLSIDADRESIYATELFEQKSLAFHYRHGTFRANVAKTENSCSVAHNRHRVLTNCELM